MAESTGNFELAHLIRRALKRGGSVEIDGFGVFSLTSGGRVSFRAADGPRVFIAYATEDYAVVEKLYRALRSRGYSPWLDRKNLLAGQNWPRRIEDAIAGADYFLACFSSNSVSKRGGFQAEVRYALDCARRLPVDDVFIVPVRLDRCRVPARIQRETQYVDLYPDFDAGVARVIESIETRRKEAA